MNRDAFLAHIAAQLGRPAGAPAPAAPHPSPAQAPLPAGELAGLFAQRLEGLHCAVRHVPSTAEALADLARLAAERDWRSLCGPPELCIPDLAPRWSDDPRSADLGLARADWAIAATGTVVLLNRGTAARSHSLVPPVSGLLVPASCLRPRLGDVLRLLDGGAELPAGVSFISGPSNTADISGVLCLGAHGPAEVIVWLIAGE